MVSRRSSFSPSPCGSPWRWCAPSAMTDVPSSMMPLAPSSPALTSTRSITMRPSFPREEIMFATNRGLLIGLAFLALSQVASASGPSALGADGPAHQNTDKLMFFGQFVGNWEFDMTATKPDGSQVTGKGEWYFGWVLEGRALQDVWIFPGRGQSELRGSWEYG